MILIKARLNKMLGGLKDVQFPLPAKHKGNRNLLDKSDYGNCKLGTKFN